MSNRYVIVGITAVAALWLYIDRVCFSTLADPIQKDLGISEEDVIKKVMLKDTVDGEFTTTQDVADVALLFASFPTNALTGQSLIVSHGWSME